MKKKENKQTKKNGINNFTARNIKIQLKNSRDDLFLSSTIQAYNHRAAQRVALMGVGGHIHTKDQRAQDAGAGVR